MFLEKSHQLGDEVMTAFSGGVHATLAAGLRGVLLALPGMEERVRGCITPQELIKLLPSPECFLRCLGKACSGTGCPASELPQLPIFSRSSVVHAATHGFGHLTLTNSPLRDQTWEF